MTKPDDLLPIGLADQLPDEARRTALLMRHVLHTMDANGYERVRPPLVEFEQSLASRMGETSYADSARKLFRFVDPASMRMLALRGDMTPQIGRIATTSLAARPRPLRLCYAGEIASITAGQLDPARQRLQLGAELVGSDNVAAAIEIVNLAIEALEAAGLGHLSVDFAIPDLVDVMAQGTIDVERASPEDIRRELDMKDAGALRELGGEAYLPLIFAAGPFEDAIGKLEHFDQQGVLASRIAGFRQVAASVVGRARLTLDPSERHGFAYQSWFGFTLYADGARQALGRGGTYKIAGDGEVATGFSLYAEPVLEAIGMDAEQTHTVFLPLGHDRVAARQLREAGWRTVAAVNSADDARTLGCSHQLEQDEPQPIAKGARLPK